MKEHRTLEELAYRDIRRAIAEGRLAPGQRIVTNAIAAESGVSRIPIIQALRRLQAEGIVRITPHKDVVVTRLSPEEFRERFRVMAVLEAFCLRESAGKITPVVLKEIRTLQAGLAAARKAKDAARGASLDAEFHMRMYRASALPRTVQMLQNLFDQGEYYRLINCARWGGFAKESLEEHEAILRALEAGDLATAAKAVEWHRLRALRRLEEKT